MISSFHVPLMSLCCLEGDEILQVSLRMGKPEVCL